MSALLSGISLTCFAASYGVAWLLEMAELTLEKRVRLFWVLGFVLAGFIAHTLYLAYRAVEHAVTPLSSNYDWCLVAAWLLIVAYLYLTYYHPRAALGLYLLPLALALIVGAKFADSTPFAPLPAARAWGVIHGVSLMLGTLTVMVGFMAGVMYLVQARRLKRKLPPQPGLNLPSLEWLERINSRVIVLSVFMIGVGFAAGMILNVVGREAGGNLPWTDPVVWSSALMLGWLMAAAVFNAVYRPARRGRKVAYLTIASFLFLLLALGVLVLVDTRHGGQKETPADRAADVKGARLNASPGVPA